MPEGISLRPLEDSDGPAFAGLSYSSPDGGSIKYTAIYQIDAVKALRALHGEIEGVVACTRDGRRLVSAALVRYGECYYEGRLHPYAMIGNIIVHPDFRRQGLAADMVAWLVEKARARGGPDLVLLATYQRGSQATRRIFSRWMPQDAGPLTYLPLPTRAGRAAQAGISIAPLAAQDYAAFAQSHNQFYREFNFYQPVNATCLEDLRRRTPFETPVRQAFTATGADGALLAGLIALEEYRLKEIEIRGLPLSLSLLSGMLRLVPADGAVRELYLDHLWYRPGHISAARQLIEEVRKAYADCATNIAVFYDPRGPLAQVFSPPPWSFMTRSNMAILGPRPLDRAKLACPIY